MNPPESCNGVDDDCDGVVDNGFACAAGTTVPCTNNCGAPSMGMCSASCAPPGPGSCVNPTEICNGLDDDCDGTIDNEPDADASCSLPDASAICVSGACVVGTCAAGFGDCDGLSATGCETSTTTTTDCGACGQTCAPVNAATASCAGGGCSYACNPGTLDCTSSPPNLDGCESDATSVTTCGGCANDCTTGPNTTSSSCSAGSCSYTCEPGYSDCDAASAPDVNGCECNATACCGGGCAVPHSNCTSGADCAAGGLGQTYYVAADPCHGPGAPFTQAMAMAAAAAWPIPGTVNGGTCFGTYLGVQKQNATSCTVWTYSGTHAGWVTFTPMSSGGCNCPSITSHSFWN